MVRWFAIPVSLSSPPGYGCATDVTRRRRRRRKETQPAGTATLPVTHWSVTLNTRVVDGVTAEVRDYHKDTEIGGQAHKESITGGIIILLSL